MYPWLWLWAPRFQFPWSGNVAQDIEPNTSWFFNGIKPEAGNARIEEKAFAVASYGKQLGLITEVLMGLAEPGPQTKARCTKAIKELKRIQAEIETVKDAEYERELLDIVHRIAALQRRGVKQSAALARKLRDAQTLA